MPLISCPKCGKQISDKAAECPGCGYRPNTTPHEKETSKQDVSGNHPAAKNLSPAFLSAAALAIAGISFAGGFMLSGRVTADFQNGNPNGAAVAVDDGELNILEGAGSKSVIKPEGEWSDSFSWQTGDETYPFAVSEKDFPQNGKHLLDPIAKRSSSYPSEINPVEAETTDVLPRIEFWMEGGLDSYYYAYELKQVETTEITVVDFNGEERKAMVNTKLALTDRHHEQRDERDSLISQNSYLFKDENGVVYMAIPDMEGADNYVLYC